MAICMKKGILAFDIDGTLTDERHLIPEKVCRTLLEKHQEGWDVCLLTGRTLSFASYSLGGLHFPYLLAIQNGADILKMPEKEPLSQAYVTSELLYFLDKLSSGLKEDFFIYSGYVLGDFCYYRPDHFTENFRHYIKELEKLSEKNWRPISQWEEIEQQSFPLIKAFGTEEELNLVLANLQKKFSCSSCIIKDPISGIYHMAMITHKLATKGKALLRMTKLLQNNGLIIAAGDDRNDISMLEEATIKIIMETAPQSMHPLADILAPPSKDCGIISALAQAEGRL